MANGRDHEIVGVLETRQWKIKIIVMSWRAFNYSLETYMTGLSTEYYFITILLCGPSTH